MPRPDTHAVYSLRRPGAKTGEVEAFIIVARDWQYAQELAAMSAGPEGPEVWLKLTEADPVGDSYWDTEYLLTVLTASKRERVVLRSVKW